MKTQQREILDRYLAELERELGNVPAVDRAEIVLEVRDHFEAATAEIENPTEADLRNILERLGSPEEIAAEARRRFGVTAVAAEPAASAGLLEVAALAGWILWTPIGVLLTALSPRWSRRTKAIAVAIELIAFALLVSFFTTPAYFGGMAFGMHFFFLLFLLVFPPTLLGIPAAGYLTWRLSRPRPRTLPSPWRYAAQTGLVLLGGWLVWTLLVGPLVLVLMHRG